MSWQPLARTWAWLVDLFGGTDAPAPVVVAPSEPAAPAPPPPPPVVVMPDPAPPPPPALSVTWVGSPNYRAGRQGHRPQAIVIHIIEGSLASADSWFGTRTSQVSAHYGVGKRGQVHQYVREEDTAWHAGRVFNPTWSLIGRLDGLNPNLVTIGIEHEGNGLEPWTDAQYVTSAALCRAICDRWGIPVDRDHIIGHREIYARKTCPGSGVDLDRLVRMVAALPTTPEVAP